MRAALIVLALAWMVIPSRAADPIPTAKEMIRYLLASHDVKLTVDPSCKGVGSEFQDFSIGDYVSGLLASQTRDGKNWIETLAKLRRPHGKDDESVWECSVVFHRQDGEEEWAWGVTFAVRIEDRKVIKKSFRCTGSG